MEEIIQHPSGIVLTRGAVPKPFDPAELKYAASAHFEAGATADLSKYVGLVDERHDSRVPVGYQESIGACAGWAACDSTATALNEYFYRQGIIQQAELLHAGAVYEDARRKRGWFPQDSGSVPSDCFDLILADAPARSSFPYKSDPAFQYPRAVWDDGRVIDQLGSHRPIYSTEPGCVELMWLGLSQGMAIEIALPWPNEWMRLTKGRIPENTPIDSNTPGHSVWLYCWFPELKAFGGANQWHELWTPDAPQTHPLLRKGDFLIPASYFGRRSSPVFDTRLVTPQPIVLPEPPKPEPSPMPNSIFVEGKYKISEAGSVVIAPSDMSPEAMKAREAFKKKQVKATITLK